MNVIHVSSPKCVSVPTAMEVMLMSVIGYEPAVKTTFL